MSRDGVKQLLRSPWWGLVALAFSIGMAVALKAEKDFDQDKLISANRALLDSTATKRDVEQLTATVSRLDNRLRAYICDGKPVYCQ